MFTQEGRFILIEGKQRAGKTLLMAILAYLEYQNSRKIFTNIAYSFDYKPIYFQELDLNDKSVVAQIRNSCVTFDEIWMLMDKRNSNSKANRKFSRWLFQIKKMGVNLYGTTHDVDLLDKRARENFDYVFQVRAIPPHESRPKDIPPTHLAVHIENGPLQRYLNKTKTIKVLPHFIDLYDTENVFDPLEPPPSSDQDLISQENGNGINPIPPFKM